MALVLGMRGSSSSTDPPSFSFSSGLLSVTDEQLESMGDDDLTLVILRFSRFHNNWLNRRRGGAKDGCYGCGDLLTFLSVITRIASSNATKERDISD